MKIVYISPEVSPFSRTGGLGDVAGALPAALAELGQDVTVITPKYRDVTAESYHIADTGLSFEVPIAERVETGRAYRTGLKERASVLFLANDHFFDRDGYYGDEHGDYVDNAERFVFLCRGALELLVKMNVRPDIIHCNDWQTALIPLYLKTKYRDAHPFRKTASVLTVHNLSYQGIFESHDMHLTDLGWNYFTPEWIEFYGKINFLKGGLVAADAIHTVSRRYAEEIQAEEFGCGLEGVLKKRNRDVFGVLNGVDYSEWNPVRDRFIKANYGPNELYGKRSCKFDLQQEFGFARDLEIPLIGILSNLVEHKGFDILSGVFPEIMKLDVQVALTGSGEKRFEEFFREAESTFPGKVGARIGQHDLVAHKIQAGADMLLMPSRFEPYGDLDRYALKYGTVPIVFAAGGLDDAIHGVSSRRNGANGFKFGRYTGADLLKTVREAVDVFRREPETWGALMKNGMSEDYSWKALAGQYVEMYETALSRALKKR